MNDGFRKALQEIADQDVSEIGLDPDWPRRVAKAALAALPDDIAPIHLEQARTKLIETVQSAHRRSSREIIATLEQFIDAKINATEHRGYLFID